MAGALILSLLLLLTAACRGKAPAVPERYAILRFENLSPDASVNWMGRAFSEIISTELPPNVVITGARFHALDRTLGPRPISAPGISTERSAAILAGATRLGYGDFTLRGGRIEARLTIENAGGGHGRVLTASAGDIVAAASELARQISPHTIAFSTRNPRAVEDYIMAQEASTPDLMQQNAAAAIADDPNFATAYVLLADVKSRRGDRDGALAALDQALAHGSALSAADRGRIEVQAAALRNDFAARQRALAEIAKANPGDVDSWRALGEAAYARHDYAQAVEAYGKALQLLPDDVNLLNLLGYSQAYNGDSDAALRTFKRYQYLRPNDPNPLDSTGDINFMSGRFREAEALYLEADKKDRKLLGGGDLFKAAMARLMTGDVRSASGLARLFDEARAALHDPNAPVLPAEWAWITGDRKGATDQLEKLAASTPPVQRETLSRACVDLAFFSLLQGDRAAAARWAVKAGNSGTPANAVPSIVAGFLAQSPVSPSEWAARADQLFPRAAQAEARDHTVSYALLLNRQFAAAAETLRRVYNGPSSDPGIPILLAWSLIETGQNEGAGPLLRLNPLPQPGGAGPYMGFYFPRLFELRARLAEKSGRPEEAAANRKLFELLNRRP